MYDTTNNVRFEWNATHCHHFLWSPLYLRIQTCDYTKQPIPNSISFPLWAGNPKLWYCYLLQSEPFDVLDWALSSFQKIWCFLATSLTYDFPLFQNSCLNTFCYLTCQKFYNIKIFCNRWSIAYYYNRHEAAQFIQLFKICTFYLSYFLVK